MKEDTYTRLLDIFTWTVVGLLALYIILWVIEYYDTKSITLNEKNLQEKDDFDFEEVKPLIEQKQSKKQRSTK
uniref:Uncharacterized protein n=1 Tax=Trepomonas sp. PC1 TaxID=1076344 RepID=A0A146KHR9_9EUKA|eukprot:JAP95374.1 Hypothetical protein TPC1_11658 [Trepomonas sp. PC1]